MKTKSRIASILNSNCLDSSITGIPSFELSQLNLPIDLDFQLPTNLRLGHLAEKIVSESIKSSSNFNVLHENIQILEDKKTIGEIDYIIEDLTAKKTIHLELAYKFYLYDPNISSKSINNWIGPNRNDSLIEKLYKLKNKQFPLLYNSNTKSELETINISEVSQALCLLVTLFIPYDYKANINPNYEKAIKGYYINLEKFKNLNDSGKTYYLPSKKEWGMNPSENLIWTDFKRIEEELIKCLNEKQAPLCWQKQNDSYTVFFIVWW